MAETLKREVEWKVEDAYVGEGKWYRDRMKHTFCASDLELTSKVYNFAFLSVPFFCFAFFFRSTRKLIKANGSNPYNEVFVAEFS